MPVTCSGYVASTPAATPFTPSGKSWAWARPGPAELCLVVKDDHDPATTGAAADLQVENADEFGRVIRETGAGGTSDPYATPYGREFVHLDPDNNLIRFVTPTARAEPGGQRHG